MAPHPDEKSTREVPVADGVAEELSDAPGFLERRLGRLSANGALRAGLVATVLGTVILAGIILRPDPLQEEEPTATFRETRVAENLAPGELLKVAEAALGVNDLGTAREALQAALTPLGDRQVKERLDIYEKLALIEDEQGDAVLAAAYREYAAKLRERLASAVVIFGEAEDALREERFDEALRLYRRFLLRRGELPEDQREFIDRARRRIADLWQARLATAGALATKTDFEPERWFDGR